MKAKNDTNKTNLNFFDIDSSNGLLTIPDSLITYTRDTVFYTWQALENQLSQVDPIKEPEMYKALDEMADGLFNSWLSFKYMGRRL